MIGDIDEMERMAGAVFGTAEPADYDTTQVLCNNVITLVTELRARNADIEQLDKELRYYEANSGTAEADRRLTGGGIDSMKIRKTLYVSELPALQALINILGEIAREAPADATVTAYGGAEGPDGNRRPVELYVSWDAEIGE